MASRTRTTHVALITYGVVLVLPTIVLGFLYWGQLQREFEAQLAGVPEDAQDAARRVVDGLQSDLTTLLETEGKRPFYHYAEEFALEDRTGPSLTVLPSPLLTEEPPKGVVGWFSYDRTEESRPPIHVFPKRSESAGPSADETVMGLSERMAPILKRYWERKDTERVFDRTIELGNSKTSQVSMAVAAVAYWQGRDLSCVRQYFHLIQDWDVNIEVSDFTLEFYLEEDGTPRAFATRTVLFYSGRPDIPPDAECLEPITNMAFRQGLILDVDWLFERRARAHARLTLYEDQSLVKPAEEFPLAENSKSFASILPVPELGFRYHTKEEENYGRLDIEVDTAFFEERFARSVRRFLGVGLLLVVTLMTGMRLLYLNVQRELEQAHRMQNFVAAVTHELRTPLSAIRLHGEMLLDGWATDPQKQRDYYKRILRETERLSTLVERVLEKSRLKEDRIVPEPGDLNELVSTIVPGLEAPEGGTEDLALQLAEDIPPVMLTREAVAGILSNLIENARKYAPREPGGEPILVRTYGHRERIILEVCDRGPGVPAAEKERIFEAFYRSGAESTRKTIGTGLGLHLVQLHATSVGARASVHDREGGGSCFRVAFRSA